MSAERESGPATPPPPASEDHIEETLTDLIDRMDREAFRRSLEQRDLRMLSSHLHRR
jgi:phage head maturation protease